MSQKEDVKFSNLVKFKSFQSIHFDRLLKTTRKSSCSLACEGHTFLFKFFVCLCFHKSQTSVKQAVKLRFPPKSLQIQSIVSSDSMFLCQILACVFVLSAKTENNIITLKYSYVWSVAVPRRALLWVVLAFYSRATTKNNLQTGRTFALYAIQIEIFPDLKTKQENVCAIPVSFTLLAFRSHSLSALCVATEGLLSMKPIKTESQQLQSCLVAFCRRLKKAL